MTDDNPRNPQNEGNDQPLRGRLLGELKLELVQAHQTQEQRQRTITERLKDVGLWLNLLTLIAVVYYAAQARIANELTRKGLGAVFDLSEITLQEGRGTIAGGLVNKGKVTARGVFGTVILTRQARNSTVSTQKTTRDFGGKHEVVIPNDGVRFIVELNAPKPTGTTEGENWRQLIGADIVEVRVRLKYDDGYGNLFEQDWCRSMYIAADGNLSVVECYNLPALLARETATPRPQKK